MLIKILYFYFERFLVISEAQKALSKTERMFIL